MASPGRGHPPALAAPALAALPGVRHGFFGRQGGVSTGLYASLNCGLGSNDGATAVGENRARVAAALGLAPDGLLTAYQVHGDTALAVTAAWPADARPRADGLVSDRPGIALGVLSADCAPVLFADAGAGVVGAAHAGWRGALAGITDAVITAMERLGARRAAMVTAVGPCISQAHYEVGAELAEAFRHAGAGNAAYFVPSARSGRFRFDLEAYVGDRLVRAGIGVVERLGTCTYAEEDRCFSYRRATHRGEPDYGRAVSAIALASDPGLA